MKKFDQLEKYNELYPKKTMKIQGGDFTYRYHINGPTTVILLAGGMGLTDTCFPIFEAFAKHCSVVTFDYPKAYPTNATLISAMAELITSNHMTNVYLIGQSYGGLVAQLMAKYHPELIKGIIVSNTGTLAYEMGFDGILNLNHMVTKSARWRDKYDKHLPMFILKPLLKIAIKKKCSVCTKDEQKRVLPVFTSVFDQITKEHMYHMDCLLADLKNEWGFVPQDFAYLDHRVLLLLSKDDDTFHPEVKEALIHIMPNPVIKDSITGGHLALVLHYQNYVDTILEFIHTIS